MEESPTRRRHLIKGVKDNSKTALRHAEVALSPAVFTKILSWRSNRSDPAAIPGTGLDAPFALHRRLRHHPRSRSGIHRRHICIMLQGKRETALSSPGNDACLHIRARGNRASQYNSPGGGYRSLFNGSPQHSEERVRVDTLADQRRACIPVFKGKKVDY